MIHVTTIQPVEEPVSRSEIRMYQGISQMDDVVRDPVLEMRITSARTWAEDYTGTRIMYQTVTAYDSTFPEREIELVGPVDSIVSIAYTDSSGVVQTLDAEDYLLDKVKNCVVPAYGKSWPAARNINNSVQITYVAGYTSANEVPEPIKDAIKFIVGQWETFQTTLESGTRPFTIPYAAMQLLDFYRDMRAKI